MKREVRYIHAGCYWVLFFLLTSDHGSIGIPQRLSCICCLFGCCVPGRNNRRPFSSPLRPFFAKGLLCCRQGFFQLRDSAEKELLLGYPVLLPFSLSLLLHNRIYLLAPSFMFTCSRSRKRVARSIVLEISREGSWRWACLFAVARTLGCIIQ